MNFSFFMPTRLFFGAGSLARLGDVKLPGRKALVVISAGTAMRRQGYLDRVIGLLGGQGVESVVFDKIQPNPVKDHVMEAAAIARAEGCDFVVGLGGGSSIDSAKSIALMANNPGDYWDYIGGGSGRGLPVPNPALPVVAITTTAGTGTEADPWTVITKADSNEKIGFGNDSTFPAVSIVDPELMLSVPPHLTAYQGMDAFFHAAEGVIASCASPISDLYALKSIELLARHLPVAVRDGANVEARAQVAFANTLSGFVESTSSCTSEHSIEHALSANHPRLAHGAGLTMISLAYFGFFVGKIPDALFVSMARAMGEDVDALPPAEQPRAFLSALAKLIAAVGLADLKMSDYGIRREELPALATNAFETMGALFGVDRHPLTHADTVSILDQSWR